MEHKAFPITEFKARDDGQPGEFEALVAVFGNVDHGGDRMVKGAFARTLKERGLPPVVWSHQWDVPPIGVVTDAVENDEGLLIKGRLFVADGEDHPLARQVYTAMKATDGQGRSPLREFSFGYDAKDAANVTENGEEIRELKDVDLFEVGPTLVGMNPATRLLAIKSALGDINVSIDAPDPTAVATQVAREIERRGTSSTSRTTEHTTTSTPPKSPAEDGDEEARARIGRLLWDRPLIPEREH